MLLSARMADSLVITYRFLRPYSLVVVNRKSLSAEFLQILSAETLSVSAERKLSVSVFLQKEPFLQKDHLSAEIAYICRNFLVFGQNKLDIYTKMSTERGYFCRKMTFLQKDLLSVLSVFLQK